METRFPAHSAHTAGTLYVKGSIDRLSAIGLRFNTSGGNAFSTVPILNCSGIFQ